VPRPHHKFADPRSQAGLRQSLALAAAMAQ
jgi:hypothetical protein